MKNFKHLCTLLLTALTFAACSNDEIVEPQQPATDAGITFTAVFGVKNGTTRALTDPDDGTLTASWAVGEEIAIVFGGNKYTASVTEVDGDGNATVSATLPSNTPNNQPVTFIYPASAADGSGLRSDLLGSQDGTLATLSSTLDVATAPGTLVVDGSAAQPNGTVTLENQYAICKFQFTDETDRPIIIESVTITDLSTTEEITVTTPSAQPAVYVAMLPSQNSTKFEVVSNDGSSYTKTANARMEAGMFYRPTFKTVCVFDSKTVPLTFEAKVANSKVYFGMGEYTGMPQFEYSKNGGEWTAYTLGAAITLENVGDKVAFRGDNAGKNITYNGNNYFHISSGQCYVYGNIMSLLYTTELPTRTTLSGSESFQGLFKNNRECLYSHPTQKLLLPATTLTYCCYQEMFYGCYNLTTAPVLPATTLAPYCYMQMFAYCFNLTTAPDLPATTLASYCYQKMFYDCISLNSVKCLATSMSANNCTTEWLSGVASSGTFTKAAGVTWSTGESGIPENWTIVEE